MTEIEQVKAALSDEEFSEVLKFVGDKLGGPQIHKVGAAAVIMLEYANLHGAAEILAMTLLRDPEFCHALKKAP